MDYSKMEVTVWPSFQHVTWKVRDFFQLPQESDSFLDSPDFHFHGDRFCMRLYPGVESKKGTVTKFHVRRLTFNSSERKVSCGIGLRRKRRDGDEWFEYWRMSFEMDCIYERSAIERERDVYVPDGSLTMVCNMMLENGERFIERDASCSTRCISPNMELTTESPCAHIELAVPQFLDLPREKVDLLASPEFRFAGDTFRLWFGRNADTGDADLNLVRLTSTFAERTLSCRVGYFSSVSPRYPRASRSLVDGSGVCASRSELVEQREKYVPGGTLRVLLFLQLVDVPQEPSGQTDLHQLQSDYGQLLQKGTESDACVVVRGKEFRVHRNVLRARSAVFEAMFGHDTAEKESGRVVVDDLDPDSFGPFLEYLYTGDVGAVLSDDNAFGLYVAADKYGVSNLKTRCVEHMRANLSLDTFCDVLTLALRYLEEDLLQQAVRFFKDNIQDIIVTPNWIQFMGENPTSGNEMFIKAIVPGKQ